MLVSQRSLGITWWYGLTDNTVIVCWTEKPMQFIIIVLALHVQLGHTSSTYNLLQGVHAAVRADASAAHVPSSKNTSV